MVSMLRNQMVAKMEILKDSLLVLAQLEGILLELVLVGSLLRELNNLELEMLAMK